MSLSIVVTTYNRSQVLERLLEDLGTQSDPDFQVVVAIDGSTDNTETMLARQRTRFDLKWVNTHCPGYGLAVARNQGILAADGRAVVILDDDSFPTPGFVAAHKGSVTAGVITGGPRNPADGENHRMLWKMRELGRLPPLVPIDIPQLRKDWPNAYLIENNICVLRDDFIRMGLFSERLKMYGFIGQEFFGRAEFLGMKYQFNPAAEVMHHGEIAGDNGLTHARKQRQTQLATLLRPTLMRPRHYLAQQAWAAAAASGRRDFQLPHFKLQAAAALPWRALRALLADAKRRLRSSRGPR